MRVLLAGDFFWNRLAASYKRAFEKLGHEVIPFGVREQRPLLKWWLRERISHRLTIGNLAARRIGSMEYNRSLVRLAEKERVDFVLACNGDFLMPETIREIRKSGTRFCIFHADNPYPPHASNRPESLQSAAECDLYLIWSGAIAERLRSDGVNAHYLPFGWDPEVFPFQGFPGEQPFDVTFIGGWDRQREAFLEEIARRFQLKIWGPPYWETRTQRRGAIRKCWQGSEISGAEAASVVARSKINLNILREQHYLNAATDAVIMRTFEVPGVGGLLLSTRSSGAEKFFPDGVAAGYFNSLDDCVNQIERYLPDQSRRLEIARNAHAIVKEGHMYSNRVKELLAYLD